EQSAAFEHDADAQVAPWELRRVAFAEHADMLVTDAQRILLRSDVHTEAAVHRVVGEQMRQRMGVGDVIHRHELDVVAAQARPQDVAADAAKAIDADRDCHTMSPRSVSSKSV